MMVDERVGEGKYGEIDEDCGPIITKKTGCVDRVDAVRNVAPRVLLFTHRNKRRGVGALDANKDPYEIGAVQQQKELGVVGEIERGFGRELERITFCFEPVCELWQERLDGFLVANKVVVDEVDITAIAKPAELVEFGEHLCVSFGARHASVKLDDVAKLAGKWAAARELHANVEIVVEFQEVEARDRRLSHVDLEFFRLEQPVARARLPGFDEFVDDALCFAEDAKIRCFVEMRARCDGGPSNNNRLSPRMAKIDNIERVALLRQHAAGEDQIGPLQVVVT